LEEIAMHPTGQPRAVCSPALAALDFGRDIARLTQDFTGRDWLFDAIEQWLHRGEQRFFILTGEPGVGKNAFIARLTQGAEHADCRQSGAGLRTVSGLSPVHGLQTVCAYHFCIDGRNSTVVPGTVFRSLAAQLVDSLPGYGLALVNTIRPEHLSVEVKIDVQQMTGGEIKGVVIDNLYAPNPRQVLDILLRAPLVHVDPPAGPCLILVGGLDAAVAYGGDANLVRLLAELDDLPPWVRFLCTSQPDRRVLRHFPPDAVRALDARSDENLADVRRYVELRVQQAELCRRLQAAAVEPQALVERLVALSTGNFLYTRVVLNDICAGQQSLDDLQALPPGLDSVYHAFLRRFTPGEWEERYQPMFGVLAVAQEPITEAQWIDFTGLTRTRVRQGLGHLLPFLDEADDGAGAKTYTLFHRSLRDYLIDGERSGEFWCVPEDGHGAIVDHYRPGDHPDWFGCDDYGLRHLTTHLVGATRWDLLAGLLPQFDFWEARAMRAGLDTVLIGLADAVGKVPPGGELWAELSGLLRVLDREAHNLRGWDPERRPAFFVQQVRNRALDEEMSGLAKSADARLSRLRQPYLSLLWRTRRESASLLRTLVGHRRYVMAVAVSRDGRAISGSADGTLKVWDPATGRLLQTLAAHEEAVRAVALTPDGRCAISASFDGTLKVWDLATGQCARDLVGHGQPVRAVVVTPDGRRAVSGSEDGALIEWDLQSGDPVYRLEGHSRAVWDVAVTTDGRWAVSVADDGQLIAWDLTTGQPVRTFAVAKRGLRAVAVIPRSHQAIVGAKDGSLAVWDLDMGEAAGPGLSAVRPDLSAVRPDLSAVRPDLSAVRPDLSAVRLAGHEASVFGVAVTPDGRFALSASNDKTLRVWDLGTGELVQVLAGHDGRVLDVAVAPDGRWAISAADDATLKVWDLWQHTLAEAAQHTLAEAAQHTLAEAAQHTLAEAAQHTLANAVLHTRAGHEAAVRAVALTPDGRLAVSAAEDGALHVWDVAAGRLLHRLRAPAPRWHDPEARWGHGAAILPGGRQCVSATSDAFLTVWDLERGAVVRVLERPLAEGQSRRGSVVRAVAVTPDGRHAITAVGDGRLTVWDVESGEAARTLEGHVGVVRAVAVTPEGERFVSAGDDGALRVWDLRTRALMDTLVREAVVREVVEGADESPASLRALALAPDGRILAGGDDGVLCVWDVQSGTLVDSLPTDGPSIRGIGVSQDGRFAVTAAIDRLVRIWDLQAKQELAAAALEGAPRSLALSPDGQTILVGDAAGNVYCLRHVAPGPGS
jgi:WD40 repeat protein